MTINLDVLMYLARIALCIAGVIAVIYLVLLFKSVIDTMGELQETLKAVNRDLIKLETPLDTVGQVSNTVNEVQASAKRAAMGAINVFSKGTEVIGGKLKNAVKSLSGGERQRLFIVLALIPNPELVFLDELTTGLDAKARRDVWSILSELKGEGLTILLTSHFMDEVEALCDEICILRRGTAVFYGTVEQARTQSGCEKFEDAYLQLSGEEDAA